MEVEKRTEGKEGVGRCVFLESEGMDDWMWVRRKIGKIVKKGLYWQLLTRV